ncbi:hypothetical protein TREMEDRAFT_60027 [Tremella mesenterica DSM 1558]|uniref:uncharacterized protein n=1 Tax=Tremella mesenterica (strain ATCC 24925 / CBS 8224 / DSM 1558 / NBRC 9311 / NRRL Y-6157 / RJB 2259-6 / UBC 559-6) TaxID=578456 RepID=UPI0003F49DE5|nr:uncharacterized protein TREMEDRAFT_60027 [Tremella mesenterica DSM 1558]EIW71085.1 hypothetical protein TREMEDRAFT_60027 [Tremella mesenterica DSM 1558]
MSLPVPPTKSPRHSIHPLPSVSHHNHSHTHPTQLVHPVPQTYQPHQSHHPHRSSQISHSHHSPQHNNYPTEVTTSNTHVGPSQIPMSDQQTIHPQSPPPVDKSEGRKGKMMIGLKKHLLGRERLSRTWEKNTPPGTPRPKTALIGDERSGFRADPRNRPGSFYLSPAEMEMTMTSPYPRPIVQSAPPTPVYTHPAA